MPREPGKLTGTGQVPQMGELKLFMEKQRLLISKTKSLHMTPRQVNPQVPVKNCSMTISLSLLALAEPGPLPLFVLRSMNTWSMLKGMLLNLNRPTGRSLLLVEVFLPNTIAQIGQNPNYYFALGAVGVEMAAEIAVACPSKKVVLVHSRPELLSSEPLPSEYKKRVQKLMSANVELHLGKRVVRHETLSSDAGMPTERVTLLTGEELDGGKIIFCGKKPAPNTQFLPADCSTEQGYVKVKPE